MSHGDKSEADAPDASLSPLTERSREALLLDLLAARDEAIGAMAEAAQARFELEQAKAQLAALHSTLTWRIGTFATRPARLLRRARSRLER